MCKEGAINNKFVRLKKQNLYLNSILAVIYLTKLISSYVKLFVRIRLSEITCEKRFVCCGDNSKKCLSIILL
jgi:hypothetical protein